MGIAVNPKFEYACVWMDEAVRLESAAQVRALLRENLKDASEILRWGVVAGEAERT